MNHFPRMQQEYLVRQVREAESAADALKFSMKTRKDALAYQTVLKKKVRRVFGPLPKRTPLNPVVVDSFERKFYTVEKILFESRPGFPVTANLYIPKGHSFPQPAVLGSCGHSHNGKAQVGYQSFCQGLVRKGYVVLIYDPPGQGERLQHFAADGKPVYGPGVREHIEDGNQQLLVGEFFGTWRVWDGIRALDYLLSRPEVDPRYVGITGNSGGGTMTTLLVANESRFTMAGPGCYVTTFRRNAENELPADSEQIPPGLLALGMDTDDLLAMHAPKPLILLTQEKDFFDQRGALECYARLKHLYRLLGAPDNVAMITGPDGHGYGKPLREAMYGFFNRVCGKTNETEKEPKLRIEPDEVLQVTQSGQVHERAPRTVFSFTAEKSKALARSRKSLHKKDVPKVLRRLLGLPSRRSMPEFRILRHIHGRDYPTPFCARYAVETEPGIQAIVHMPCNEAHQSRPPRKGKRATVYISHLSADEDMRDNDFARKLLNDERNFFAVDVRGIGESRPNTCGKDTYFQPYGCDYLYSSYGILFSYPLVGQRTHDMLSVLDFLAEHGYENIHLAGRGWGSLPALFAAVLDSRIKRVTLVNCPLSYAELAETEHQAWPLSSLLPGVLKKMDLPDCHRYVGRKLKIIRPWNAKMES